MSVSAIFGCRLVAFGTQTPCLGGDATVRAAPLVRVGGGGLVIESSSRPQKKATAHHRKTRPKKSQPWDIKRGPTVYPPLPELPPEWTLVTDNEAANTHITATVVAGESAVVAVDSVSA